MSVQTRTLADERGRALPLDRIDGGAHPVSKVKSKLDGIDSLVRDVGAHPWAHLEAGYWRIQVEDRPVLGYVIRHRAELGDPFTFELYADARNDQGQRIWIRREHSLNTAVAWMVQHSAELIAFAARARSASRGPAETTAAEHASADVDQARELGHVERGQLG
nr:hypothetical protein [Clavibacter sp. VKM Ac-2872]